MTVGKVKDFNFSSGGMAKGYAMGGSAKPGQSVQMAKSNAVAKTLVGQKMTPMAKGGEARIKDTIRNERQELNRVSAKQRDAGREMSRVRSEMSYDKNELKGMAKGGKVPSAPQGMIKSRGALGVIANKNPGETRMHTAPNLPGEKMMMNKGGMAMSKGKGKNC